MLLQRNQATARRGVILMVVLAMLTLFAILGLAFVLFAEAAALSASTAKMVENKNKPDMDPELAMSMFLGQLIYDVHDDTTGMQSSLRGHSLARNMYGANIVQATDPNTGQPATDGAGRPVWIGDNSMPFNGTGRLYDLGAGTPQIPTTIPQGTDDYTLVNYMAFDSDAIPGATPAKAAVRDPERWGWRGINDPPQPFTGGLNGPYTYCDANNMFLASQNPVTGEILVPSFHRPNVTGGFGSLTPNNPAWTNSSADLKYKVLRPRGGAGGPASTNHAEHPNFPKPLDSGGDVKNLDWAPGGCDSIWIDIGAPVMQMADGTKYKMLVAPLILDLDGRLNLNVAGNILGAGNAHASNQGWGPWEMNPGKVLNATINPTEWQNIFLGSNYQNATAKTVDNWGRYGSLPVTLADGRSVPFPNGRAPLGGTFLHNYAQIDMNGVIDIGQTGAGAPTGNYLLSGAGRAQLPIWFSFPYFPPNGYGNAVPVETTSDGTINGTGIHPQIFNPVQPGGDDRLLSVQSMHGLLRAGGTGSEFVTSDLRLFMDNLFRDVNALKRRNQVTTISWDLDHPGVLPYVFQPNNPNNRSLNYHINSNDPAGPPYYPIAAPSVPYPDISQRATLQVPGGSEFDPATWRSVLATLGRVNLNRPLAPYPAISPTTGQLDLSNSTNLQQYNQAYADRMFFCDDLFNALLLATGALDPATARTSYGVTSDEYKATRWLAQLAVNIVDYIDEDDYITTYQFDTTGNTTPGDNGWVYGVELPRLVINEIYAQMDNDALDPYLYGSPKYQAFPWFRKNVWVELHNPLPAETYPANHTHSNHNAQLFLNGTPVYQVVVISSNDPANGDDALDLFKPGRPLGDPANGTGDPSFGGYLNQNFVYGMFPTALSHPTNWGTNTSVTPNTHTYVAPSNGAYSSLSGPLNGNQGFFVLGPQPPANTSAPNNRYVPTDAARPFPANFETLLTDQLSLPALDNPKTGVTVVLRRLANPHMPFQASQTTGYNPYITVDVARLVENNTVSQVWGNDARAFLHGDPLNAPNADLANGTPPFKAVNARVSYGRIQPYASGNQPVLNPMIAQAPQNPPGGQPLTTFFRQNAKSATPGPIAAGDTLKVQFDWLTHLDRQLISPIELLNVSAVKPYELTYWFQRGSTQAPPQNGGSSSVNPSLHLARWTDPNTRLARFLDCVTTPSRFNGVAPGGRTPGKININTMQGQEVWRAICDAQPGNTFYNAASPDLIIDQLYAALIAQRDAGGPQNTPAPYMGLGVGNFTNSSDNVTPSGNRGLDRSILRSTFGANAAWTMQRMLEDPTAQPGVKDHPYQRYELLNKIFNNLTVRSNVFAVWCTVGFFVIEDDTRRPVRLGAEVGRLENRHIRHRMFAIIDRTNMEMYRATLGATITPPSNALYTLETILKPTAVMSRINQKSNLLWDMSPGSIITMEPNTQNEETAILFEGQGNQLQGKFYNAGGHPTNTFVVVRGNPGPMVRYDPRKDNAVVPYFAIID